MGDQVSPAEAAAAEAAEAEAADAAEAEAVEPPKKKKKKAAAPGQLLDRESFDRVLQRPSTLCCSHHSALCSRCVAATILQLMCCDQLPHCAAVVFAA